MTKGFYGGGTFGAVTPIGGVGAGLYFDNHRNFYPQLYYGTPKFGFSAGYSPDLEGLLTGTSVSGNFGSRFFRSNVGASNSAIGGGIGTPGFGATYGFGPYKLAPAPPEAAGEVNPAIYSTGFELSHSDPRDSFRERFGKWSSSPSKIVPSPAAGRTGSFNDRFGNWGTAPTDDSDNPRSPLLRELERSRKSQAPDISLPSPSALNAAAPNPGRSLVDAGQPVGSIAPHLNLPGLPSWMRNALAHQPQGGSVLAALPDEDYETGADDQRNIRVLSRVKY